MKYLAIPLMLCITGWCNAQSSDFESERRRRAEADSRAAEAAAAAEAERRRRWEWQREQDQPRLQYPILRFPEDGSLFAQAEALEREGRGAEAVNLYVRAARGGSGKAAKRLGWIYDKGIAGVARDYRESLKWYNLARSLGEAVPLKKDQQ
ncbi:MAG TPA: hypothetical protein VGJ74_02945 [Burkholderiales bacterium]|jgi:TPR repeat protein